MNAKKNVFDVLLTYIENADDKQLNQIMTAIECRYRSAYPDWEVIYIAVHREQENRKKDIDSIVERLYKI